MIGEVLFPVCTGGTIFGSHYEVDDVLVEYGVVKQNTIGHSDAGLRLAECPEIDDAEMFIGNGIEDSFCFPAEENVCVFSKVKEVVTCFENGDRFGTASVGCGMGGFVLPCSRMGKRE